MSRKVVIHSKNGICKFPVKFLSMSVVKQEYLWEEYWN